jgi:hypothetical protein
MILEGLSTGISDGQMLTAMALGLATLTTMSCKVSAYHWNLICYVILLCLSSSLGSIFVVRIRPKDCFKWTVRIFIMFFASMFSIATLARAPFMESLFPLGKPRDKISITVGEAPFISEVWSTGLVIPATCYFRHGPPNGMLHDNFTATQAWVDYPPDSKLKGRYDAFSSQDRQDSDSYRALVIFMIFGFLVFLCMAIYLVSKAFNTSRKHSSVSDRSGANAEPDEEPDAPGKLVCPALAVLLALWGVIYSLVQYTMLRDWMNTSGWLVNDDGERSYTSYGQFMAIVLAMLPFANLLQEGFRTFHFSLLEATCWVCIY